MSIRRTLSATMTESSELSEEVENMETEENAEEIEDESKPQKKKKGRTFYAKEFRRQLSSSNAHDSIKEFITLVHEETQDCALEYLESGGSCIEIVRVIDTLENKSASNVMYVLEALHVILLKIISSHPQKTLNGEESCRELLNKHFSVIKSCLALSSTNHQRRVVLKLLATMVTLSDKLAQEVLSQIFFDESCLQVLSAPSNTEDGSAVRVSFIHFIVSFLIEGQTDIIQLLVKKKALLQCVFPGLQYDTPDIIELFLSMVQTNILENPNLYKVVKMQLFTQRVIRNIVSLYNWKGPKSWNPTKKKSNSALTIPQDEKQLICDTAHQFLLVLCTSKNFGIVFSDDHLGLTNTKHNNLLVNVVKSLNKPWNNKYVSDLVINICSACPDIVPEVLYDVDSSLEVRISQNWLNVIHFIRNLFDKLNSSNVEEFLPKLTSKQLLTAVQTFCVPQNILKIILTQGLVHEHIGVRHECLLLLHVFLNSLENRLNFINISEEISSDSKQFLKRKLMKYLNKNLPQTLVLQKDWDKFDHKNEEDIIPIPKYSAYLSLLINILYKYKIICPELLDQLTTQLDANKILKTLENLKSDNTVEMQIKVFNLFISIDMSLFHISNEQFSYTFPLLLKLYSENSENAEIVEILGKVLTVSGIFEGCDHEILVFLYSVLQLENFDEPLVQFLTKVLQDTSENFLKYNSEIGLLKDGTSDDTTFSIKNWLQVNSKDNYVVKLNHRILSPLVVGLLNQLLNDNSEIERINKILVHLLFAQTNHNFIISLFSQERYKPIVSKCLIKYCKNTDVSDLNQLKKSLSTRNNFIQIFNYILSEESDIDLANLNIPSYYNTLLTNFIIYFYTESATQQKLSQPTQKKCLEIIFLIINKSTNDKTLQNCLNSILKHPGLLKLFSPTQNNKQTIEHLGTEFIVEIIEHLLKSKTKDDLEGFLKVFRGKLVNNICSVLRSFTSDAGKNDKLLDIVKIFGFSFEDSCEILKIISDLPYTAYIKENNPTIVSELLSYIFSNSYSNLKPYDNEIITKVSKSLQEIYTAKIEVNFDDLENNLCSYISRFPHVNAYLDKKLFESLLTKNNSTKSSIKLATILVKHNKDLVQVFEQNLNAIFEKRELVFSVLNVIKDLEDSKSILEHVYKEYEHKIILKFINKPQKISNYLIDNYTVVVKLVQDYLSIENCNNIAAKVQKYDVTEQYHTEVLQTVFNKSILQESNKESQIKLCTNFIVTFMNLLTNTLKRPEVDWDKIESISKYFNTYLVKIKHVYKLNYNDESLYKNAAFQNLSKLCLKFGLQNHVILIVFLKRLCSLTTGKNPELGALFEMAIAHSESLNILLSKNYMKPPYLGLLLVLCEKCPSVMSKSHIPVFLGAYSGTLSESDQYILRLLSLYESADLGFHEYRPYLWGEAAITHYSVKTGGATNLWRLPNPKQVVDIFNERKIKNTVTHFPKKRKLRILEQLYSESALDVYDPCFYLPLLSHILAPESTVRWYHITNKSVICLVIVCLTSECQDIRAAAFHVLARLHNHLVAAHNAKSRHLWLHLIESICRGASAQPSLSISSPVAVFLCRAASIFSNPDHELYMPLFKYITHSERPNFNKIPELMDMLFNDTVEHKVHTEFILKVVRDGINNSDDLKDVFRSMVFKFIMDLYNSTLSSLDSKKLILQIISNTVSITYGTQVLVKNNCLLPWLQTNLQQINVREYELLNLFIDILNNIVTNMSFPKLKYIRFKVLLILVAIIDKLKHSQIELNQLVKFVKILYSTSARQVNILSRTQLSDLLTLSSKFIDCNICNYYLNFGTEFIEKPTQKTDNSNEILGYYLELLTLKWIEASKC